jgi:type III secretion system needle length determinant
VIQVIENQPAQNGARVERQGNAGKENTFPILLNGAMAGSAMNGTGTAPVMKKFAPAKKMQNADVMQPSADGAFAAGQMQITPGFVWAGPVNAAASPPVLAPDVLPQAQEAPSVTAPACIQQASIVPAKLAAAPQQTNFTQAELAACPSEPPETTEKAADLNAAPVLFTTQTQTADQAQGVLSGVAQSENGKKAISPEISVAQEVPAHESAGLRVQAYGAKQPGENAAEGKEISGVSKGHTPSLSFEDDAKNEDVEAVRAPLADSALPGDMATIKVSDESSDIRPSVAQQVTNQISVNIGKENLEFKMQLYPNDLGKIEVKIHEKNGMLTVELTASNSKTQDLLAAQSDKVRELLEASQGKPVHIHCPQQEAAAYTQPDARQQSGHAGQRHAEPSRPDDDAVTESAEGFLTFLEMLKMQAV